MTDLYFQTKANQPTEMLDWVNEQDEIKFSHFMYYYVGEYDQQVIQVEPAEVSEVRFLNWSELQVLEKEGQSVNHHHFPICQQIWNGEIDLI